MMQIHPLVAGVALVVGGSLLGCGGGGDESTTQSPPGPVPTPYAPKTVTEAWTNHFDAFATFDVAKIMLDYDEDSVVATFNDKCQNAKFNETSLGYKEHKGTAAIKTMFEALFKAMNYSLASLNGVGPLNYGNATNGPSVIDGEGAAGSVFLTWGHKTGGFDRATDTFSFKKVGDIVKVRKQTIVTTEPNTDCEDAGPTVIPTDGAIAQGWNNHFVAFGTENTTMILEDYTEDSLLQVFDKEVGEYQDYKGLEKIGSFFDALWTALADGGDPKSKPGFGADLLKVEPNLGCVFLVWHSDAFPKATDTFIFNDAGKIIHQTIFTNSKPAPAASSFIV